MLKVLGGQDFLEESLVAHHRDSPWGGGEEVRGQERRRVRS